MSWISRRVHQRIRVANAHGWGIAQDVLTERRRKPLRRYQRRIQSEIDRMGRKQLLHNGGKP